MQYLLVKAALGYRIFLVDRQICCGRRSLLRYRDICDFGDGSQCATGACFARIVTTLCKLGDCSKSTPCSLSLRPSFPPVP